MTQSETTSAAGGGEKPPHVESFAINPEGGPDIYVEGHNRFVNEDDFLEYKAWAERKIAALAAPTAKGGTEVPADPLVAYLERQWAWSKETFGPALRTKGIVQHITKELREIEADPHDLAEWVDVIILAMDGFWRHGGKPSDLLPAMQAKQDRNFARTWPDWRTMGEDQAIEHDRSGEASPPPPARAAGGGSGDLGALSAGARAKLVARLGQPHCWVVPGQDTANDYGYIDAHCCNEGEMSKPLWSFESILAALSAPAPDLGAQGEPVAWAYEELRTRTFDEWEPALSYDRPGPASWFRNIRPLYEAPAAPRTGSGVSVEEIAQAIRKAFVENWVEDGWRKWDEDVLLLGCRKVGGGKGYEKPEQAAENLALDAARAILALFAQAPRDGGETQAGWRLVPEEPSQRMIGEGKSALWGHLQPAMAMGDVRNGILTTVYPDGCETNAMLAYRAMLAAAPTPPSGAETIRQDSEGAADE